MSDKPQPQQIDISKAELVDLYKFAYEQQREITFFIAQLNQAQTNISAIEAEIKKRLDEQQAGN